MAHGRYVLWVSLWSLCSGAALAAAPPVDYQRDIKPLLKERCFACHGALQQQAGLPHWIRRRSCFWEASQARQSSHRMLRPACWCSG